MPQFLKVANIFLGLSGTMMHPSYGHFLKPVFLLAACFGSSFFIFDWILCNLTTLIILLAFIKQDYFLLV